jgi:hypothetical protein
MKLKGGWRRLTSILLVGFITLTVTAAPVLATSPQVTPPPVLLAQSANKNDPDTPPPLPEPQCAVSVMGYLICGLSYLIGKLLDGGFYVLEQLLIVRPLDLSTNGGQRLYQIWGALRNVANVIIVLVLLAIIFSHITGLGLTNYNIKRMMPRLIVNVVLVNVSFFIGLLVIDVANVVGGEIYDIMKNLAKLAGPVDIGVGGGVVAILGLAALGGLLFVFATSLIGLLGSALVTIFIVLIYFIARQAILLILIVLSPVAFALNILPGTQKWFSKWWNALFSSAMVYPVIGLIFGSGVVAASIIRVSPVSGIPGGSGISALLALAAQVLPFAMVPKFMKMGGALMNQVSSIINKPNAGIFGGIQDRTGRLGKRIETRRQINNLANGKQLSPYSALNRIRATMSSKERQQKRQLKRGSRKSGRSAYDDFYAKNADKIIDKGTIGIPEDGGLRDRRKKAEAAKVAGMNLDLALSDIDIQEFALDMQGANLANLRSIASDTSRDIGDTKRIAAICKLASQGNLVELHSILEMIQAEGGGDNQVLTQALSDSIEKSGINQEAIHFTGGGLDSVRDGSAFQTGNVVANLYSGAIDAGKLSSEEGLSHQSTAALSEMNRYRANFTNEQQTSVGKAARDLQQNNRLQLNMSGSALRENNRLAGW